VVPSTPLTPLVTSEDADDFNDDAKTDERFLSP
jgi:hypothetical protein